MTTQYDIIIVGAGLVGATFAALLDKAISQYSSGDNGKITIALIDSGDAPQLPDFHSKVPEFDPRVVALTQTSQHIFDHLDIWQTICQQRACPYTNMYVWDNEGTASIGFCADEIHQPQLGYIVENSILQTAVLEKFHQDTTVVTVLRGIHVSGLAEGEHGSVLNCSDGSTLIGKLIVAADGGQSMVRELANIQTREWDYQHKAIVATVESSNSHEYTAWQNFLSTGPLAFLPLQHPTENYCSIVWSLDSEVADTMMSLDETAFCEQLERAFEQRLGKVISVSRRFCFPLKQRHALQYSINNIVLIGDAAHTIHPLAGQGVNLGLLDAQALAAEITRAYQRNLPINEPSIMRRYQRKRKTHNMEVMLVMEGFKRLFGSRHLMVRLLRNIGLKKVDQFPWLKNLIAKQAVNNG